VTSTPAATSTVATVFEATTGGIQAAYPGALANGAGYAIAVDGTGNVWFAEDAGTTTKYMSELSLSGGTYTYNKDKYALGSANYAMAIDNYSTGRIWEVNAGSSNGNIEGYLIGSSSFFNSGFANGTASNNVDLPWGIAVDSSNNVWVANEKSNGAQTGAHDVGTLEEIVPSNTAPGTTAPTFSNINTAGALDSPKNIAIDGANNIWIANSASLNDNGVTYYGISEYSTTSAAYLSPLDSTGGTPIGFARTGAMNAPVGVAVDGSGNVWIANGGSSNVTEFVGAATPVITPIAKGLTAGYTPAYKP
jgi:hypothetical protein